MFPICRLERQRCRDAFDCGDSALNRYIHQFAWQNQNRFGLGITYVMVNDLMPPGLGFGPYVVGYYTLAMSEVPTASLAAANLGKLPYKMVPAVLLARLAVDKEMRGRGLGTRLLGDAVARSVEIGQTVGCRCIVVDAYPSAVHWYTKFGFVVVSDSEPGFANCKMILDLRTATAALLNL